MLGSLSLCAPGSLILITPNSGQGIEDSGCCSQDTSKPRGVRDIWDGWNDCMMNETGTAQAQAD